MKTLVLTAISAALIFAGTAAFAEDHHGGGHPGGGHPGGGGAPHAVAPRMPHNSMNRTTTHQSVNRTTTRNVNVNRSRNVTRTTRANTTHRTKTNYSHGRIKNTTRKNVNVHVNIKNFNRRNVSARRHYHYRGGAYRWPGGYRYQRWAYGERLPAVFWARNYWIDDYSYYGLGYPPDGAVWVRYGDDALLIDQDSGEILEVVYGQFY